MSHYLHSIDFCRSTRQGYFAFYFGGKSLFAPNLRGKLTKKYDSQFNLQNPIAWRFYDKLFFILKANECSFKNYIDG